MLYIKHAVHLNYTDYRELTYTGVRLKTKERTQTHTTAYKSCVMLFVNIIRTQANTSAHSAATIYCFSSIILFSSKNAVLYCFILLFGRFSPNSHILYCFRILYREKWLHYPSNRDNCFRVSVCLSVCPGLFLCISCA